MVPADPYFMTEFNYLNFASLDGLATQSVYGITDNNIYLTSYLVGNDSGSVYRTSAVRFDRSFSMAWNIEIGGGSPNYADGYTLQWAPTNTDAGGYGTSAGRATNTVQAITFATFSDPGIKWFKANNLQVGGVVLPSATNTISWRQNVYYWADYDHAAQTIKIYYSTSTVKPTTPQHTINSFFFDSGNYYVGFGAGTGGYTDNHIIKAMSLRFIG